MRKVPSTVFAVVAAAMFHAGCGKDQGAPPPAQDAVNKPAPVLDITNLQAKAAQGDVEAQVQLGKAYSEGAGVKPDFKQAARWYGMAASNGNVQGEAMFGELCLAGRGGTKDTNAAIMWLTKAADEGSVAAQYDLAFAYERGQKGFPHDDKQAACWYGAASEGGDSLAQYEYGQRLISGFGVAADPVEGLKWLLVAASQGQTDSAEKAKAQEKKMSSDQVAEAKRRAASFTPHLVKGPVGQQTMTNAAASK
jgi:TPR repeat protein